MSKVATLNKSTPQKLRLEAVRTDLGTQMRPRLNSEVVEDYRQKLEDGLNLGEMEVYHDGQMYILVDGFHRYEAQKLLGAKEIVCQVHPGTLRDALLRAAQVNEAHGLRRDRDTKRRAVMTLLADEEWRQWSDREIARQCLVSHTFVAEIRKGFIPDTPQVATLPPEPAPVATRKGGDGKVYPARPAKPQRKERFEPSLEQLEATSNKPLSVEALTMVVADWLQANSPSMPPQTALRAVLNGESAAVEALGHWLRNMRKVLFNWPDVLEAATRLLERMAPERYGDGEEKPPVEGLETIEDFAKVMFEEWLGENNLDLRNLTLPQCYQFAFWLGCKNGSDRIDAGAGEVIANLVSGLVDPPSVTPEDLSAKAKAVRKPYLDDAVRDFLDWYCGDSEAKPRRSILQGLLKNGRNDPAYNSLMGYLGKRKLGHAKLPHIHTAIEILLREMGSKPALEGAPLAGGGA